MCRSNVEKETFFLNQNAAGSNSAHVEEMKLHLSTISIVLLIICTILGLGALYFFYKQYKKCHHSWIRTQILQNNLRRSFSRPRGIPGDEQEVNIPMK